MISENGTGCRDGFQEAVVISDDHMMTGCAAVALIKRILKNLISKKVSLQKWTLNTYMCQIYLQVKFQPSSQHSDHSACVMNQKLDSACHLSGYSHWKRDAERLQSGAQVSAHSGLTEEVDSEWYYWRDVKINPERDMRHNERAVRLITDVFTVGLVASRTAQEPNCTQLAPPKMDQNGYIYYFSLVKTWCCYYTQYNLTADSSIEYLGVAARSLELLTSCRDEVRVHSQI